GTPIASTSTTKLMLSGVFALSLASAVPDISDATYWPTWTPVTPCNCAIAGTALINVCADLALSLTSPDIRMVVTAPPTPSPKEIGVWHGARTKFTSPGWTFFDHSVGSLRRARRPGERNVSICDASYRINMA